jgi:superfamily II DNA or RNA helicase
MENNTIKILANAVTCKVDTEDRNVKLEVNRCLTYFVDGYEQSTAFKMHTWDGTASFFNFAKGTFPAGFMYYVGACLKRKGYDVQFYKKPLPKPLGKLRPKIGNYEYDPRYEYQYTVTEKLLKHGQIICRAATGAGKSLIALIAFATINRPTLFLTTRSILMYQMKENVENNLGIDVAVIGDGNLGFENSDGSKSLKKFTVATVQTIHSYIKEPNPTDSAYEFTAQRKRQEFMKSILEKFEFVILEEAHESSASGWFELLKYCKNAYYRLALTGTPFMKESEEMNMRLMASSGPVAITVTEKQLIDCGILATPYFKFVHLTKKPATMSMKTSWQPAYRIGIVENEERNQAIIYEARRAVSHGLTVMILFKQIAHGKTLKEMLDDARIPNELIVGADDQAERKRAINKLKDGKIKVLLGSTILDVGVDVPAVGMVIIASAGKAEVALRQRIGRGLRAKKNQANICFVVDFDDPFNKYLKNHAQQRKAIIQHTDGFKEHIVEDFDYNLLKEKLC